MEWRKQRPIKDVILAGRLGLPSWLFLGFGLALPYQAESSSHGPCPVRLKDKGIGEASRCFFEHCKMMLVWLILWTVESTMRLDCDRWRSPAVLLSFLLAL